MKKKKETVHLSIHLPRRSHCQTRFAGLHPQILEADLVLAGIAANQFKK